ncbi:acylphosphatase, partial [Candidatus Roizmanbacteria bacterium CG17_big_fil_post_rev_8_21_14_2_50_39_7]
KVEEIVEKIKEGPPVSRVDDVELYWQNIKEVFEGFEIRK